MAGRYKLNNDQSVYYDPNDTGPNQASPQQIAAYQQSQPAGAPSPNPAPSAPTVDSYTARPDGYTGAGLDMPQAPWTGGYTGTGTNPDFTNQGGGPNDPRWTNGTWGGSAPAVPPVKQPTASPSYATMEGIDVNKLNDATHTTPKYVASRILASGGSLQQAASAIGATVLDATRMRLPSGEVIDTRRDEEGANALQWLVQGADDGINHGGDTGTAMTGPSGATSIMGSTLGGQQGASGVGSTGFNDQVRQLLMQQLGGLSGPLTANDPQIAAEMGAQEATLERQRRQRRAVDAERAAMNGLLNGGQSSGSFEQNIASGFEDKGQALTGIQAQLFTRELQSRRSYVANLMNMALQSGDNEAARNLQYTLAQMDDVIRRMSLQQNQSQWNDSFGLQAGQFQYQKDRDLAQYGAGY